MAVDPNTDIGGTRLLAGLVGTVQEALAFGIHATGSHAACPRLCCFPNLCGCMPTAPSAGIQENGDRGPAARARRMPSPRTHWVVSVRPQKLQWYP